jgi:AraC-like DNA-binding protein
MNLNIISSDHGPITFQAVLPENYNGLILPGGSIISSVKDFGTIIFQEIKTEEFLIRYNFFHFVQKLTLTQNEETHNLQILLALKNELKQKIKSIDDSRLKQGQFTSFYTPRTQIKTLFKKEKEYYVFHTHYSMPLIEQLVATFPFLADHVKSAAAQKPFTISNSKWAPPQMQEIVQNILHCPYDENLRRFYFENKVKEFLFLMLVQASKKEPETQKILPHEIEAVHHARSIILNDLEKHMTIPDISKKIGLNEFKLKLLFKKVFDIGVFETLLRARMQKARTLILETDKPIKEIASLIGYERVTSFITAFQKHFGYTPGSLRRK